jgi:hypothetical protein
MTGLSGDATNAASLLAEARALRKGTGGPRLTVACDYGIVVEAYTRLYLMQWEQAVTEARRAAETYRAIGALYAAADAEAVVGWEIFLGRTAEAAEHLPGALTRADRVGHQGAVSCGKWLCAWLSAARGDLTAAGQGAEDGWNFGEAYGDPWNFLTDTLRGQLAFLRGNFTEAQEAGSGARGARHPWR